MIGDIEHPLATIKHLNVDELDAYYCDACWAKSLRLKPLGKSEQFEKMPKDTTIWCMFNLTHGVIK